ncbi:hypothetical protein C8N46_102207 [Kordia periserrulae]|uniref:Uncharacterized protein n=1 Tax=Kordia periserrulae TaxID=701523 RepID=A0A2T6C3H8_9FLAO|nr:hypothetical protein [Kordia periserrulae]PTX62807.1 hypothetical protein C8N46_102207 [Kordia periserrulae]
MKSQKRIQLKKHLTIQTVGKIRFWIGIGLGLLQAFILYSFIFFFLEIVNVLRVGMLYDIPFQTKEALYFEHIFLIALAIAIGNHTMIRYWFSQPTFHFYKTRRQISLRIVNYSLFIEFLCWYMIVAFLRDTAVSQVLIGTAVYMFYSYVFFCIPIYLFLTAWTEVARFFKVWKWKLYAFGICLFCVISFSFVNPSNFRYAETVYENMYQEELFYERTQFEIAEKEYGITYSDEIILTLKSISNGKLQKLLLDTKQQFETNKKVTLKDIILQKILIHNFKSAEFEGYGVQYYPEPIDVYVQLKKVASSSAEATELLNILDEFYQLTFFIYERRDIENTSITFMKKNSILPDLHDYHYFDLYEYFKKMNAQIKVITYALSKQTEYEHPFTEEIKNTQLPPPPPLIEENIYKRFPELKYTLE